MVTRLSGDLDRRHRLVRADSILRPGDRRLSRYRFRHILFQRYLYGTLDDIERVQLHEEVGDNLEDLYGDRTADIAVQLAHHFEEAEITEKLGSFYLARAEHQKSVQLTERVLSLARRMEDTLQVAMARWGLGVVLVHMGALEPAREHLEHVIAFYDPEQHGSLALTFGQDPGASARAWVSWALWFLGYPDQALVRSQETLALALDLDHPFTLGFALNIAGSLFHQLRRENRIARERNEAMLRLSAEKGFPFFQVLGTVFQGWTQAMAGQVEEGIAQMGQGLDTLQAIGTGMERSHLLALLVEAHAAAGQVEQGLKIAAEALAFVEHSGERYYEAEIHRLRGELLLQQGDETEAGASFQGAIEVARAQQARSWELRATVSLCRMWQELGRREEARQRLAKIYGWFTEGFDTEDLKEAKVLLEKLA
jgi:adenylate cyclase